MITCARTVIHTEDHGDEEAGRERLVIEKADLEPRRTGDTNGRSAPPLFPVPPFWARGGTRASRLVLSASAGTLGAVVAWAAAEPFIRGEYLSVGARVWLLALMAGAMGCALAVVDGLHAGNVRRAVWGGLVALCVGAALGVLAALVTGRLVHHMFEPAEYVDLRRVLARAVAWAHLGAVVGLAQGLVFGSRWKAKRGIIGGLLGAGVAGLFFLPLLEFTSMPWLGRLFGISLIGALTGLGIGLSQEVRRAAWLAVTRGPLAACEFVLHRPATVIGSAAECDIRLRGDPGVGPMHAVVRAGPGGCIIEDLGSPTGTFINGTLVRKQRLHNADSIRLGGTLLIYHERDLTPSGVSSNGAIQAHETP